MPTPQTSQTGTVAWGQLIGAVAQSIPQPVAKQLVAQAWRTICRAREWGFLRAEGYLVAPAAIQGSVTFARASTTATADSTLRTLIETPSINPLAEITKFAIRDAEDVIYQVRGYDGTTGEITLNKPYLGTDGTRTVTFFRQYFTPPITEVSERGANVESGNFRSWLSVSDTATNYRWIDTSRTAQWIDQADPTRRRTGEPTHIVQAPYDTLGLQIASGGSPLFELWPHYIGNTSKIYHCKFYRDYIPLSDSPGEVANLLPHAIPLSYLIVQAKLAAYEWAEANKADYPSLQKSNWFQLIGLAATKAQEEFLDAQRADEAMYPENVDNSLRSRGYGLYNPQTTMPGPLNWPYQY